ncbi:MAG: hypothetical protein ACKO96_16525 [Flammeovirgaceae bacterium]
MNDKINLELNVNEVNVVLSALREMPYRLVNDVLNNIIAQAQSQLPTQSEETKQ